jgi:hypothetical protein
MTTHSQWLSKARSIPYWTTNVPSSTVDCVTFERLLYKPLLNNASVNTFKDYAVNSGRTSVAR